MIDPYYVPHSRVRQGFRPRQPNPFPRGVHLRTRLLAHHGGLVILAIWHPGRYLGPESEFPKISRKEKKAMKMAEKEAKMAVKDGRRFNVAESEVSSTFAR